MTKTHWIIAGLIVVATIPAYFVYSATQTYMQMRRDAATPIELGTKAKDKAVEAYQKADKEKIKERLNDAKARLDDAFDKLEKRKKD